MKVREEIDALKTMGLEPVRFLVVPRVLAGVVMTPGARCSPICWASWAILSS
jgi:ABC-type transporter Mla maintaining outer membrane lipid asymmetry permease subunit MlaE